MALKKFDFGAIVEMDGGRHKIAFNQALARCVDDCIDRPGDKAKRRIAFEVEISPSINSQTGELDDVAINMKLIERLPKRQSKPYAMKAHGKALVFNEISPDDPSQMTFDMGGPKLKSDEPKAAEVG